MVRDRVARRWFQCAVVATFMLLVMGGAAPALANAVQSGGIVVDVATPEGERDESAQTPTPAPEEAPGGLEGGGSPEESSTPTPTPTGETGGEALAPGSVTVVVQTSDKGALPERALVCIGEVCQSVSGARSGIDLWFDRVERGRQQIVVTVGAPYGATTADVEVVPGLNSRVELTLVVTQPIPGEKFDPTPPPVSAEGPLRTPLQQEGPTTSTALSVSALPATGMADDSPGAGPLVPTFAAIAALLLVAGTMLRGHCRL